MTNKLLLALIICLTALLIFSLIVNSGILDIFITHPPIPTVKRYIIIEKHRNDSQNSHDSAVIKQQSNKINKLVSLYGNIDTEWIKEISLIISLYQDKVKKYKLNRVLEKIVESNDNIMSFNMMKETKIVSMLWERIRNNYDLINIFMENMESCLEPSVFIIPTDIIIPGDVTPEEEEQIMAIENTLSVVCANGRVSKLLSTLTLVDPDKDLAEPEKDVQEIKNEMYQKAAKYRNDFIGRENLKKLYESDLFSEDLSNKLRTYISERIIAEYRNLIPANILDSTLNTILMAL